MMTGMGAPGRGARSPARRARCAARAEGPGKRRAPPAAGAQLERITAKPPSERRSAKGLGGGYNGPEFFLIFMRRANVKPKKARSPLSVQPRR